MWGVVPSPFIATYCNRQIVRDNGTNAPIITTNAIEKNIYVDDLLKILDSIDDVVIVNTLVHESQEGTIQRFWLYAHKMVIELE